jgi:TolB protein
MSGQPEPAGASRSSRARNRRVGWTIRITPLGVVLLVVFNLLVVSGLAIGIIQILQSPDLPWKISLVMPSDTPVAEMTQTKAAPTLTHTSVPSASPTTQPAETSTPVPATSSPQPISTLTLNQGLILMALDEGGNTHLFAYQPQESGAGQPLPLTRLTSGPWDDINPAISPDGQTVAFASNRTGYWDIYLLNLSSGGITRLTDTLTYEAAPSWSPDNQWLAYETYANDNLEIKIQSIVAPTDIITLTNNAAANFSPAWSPKGRQIAFVSDRSGDNEIWLADLDKADEQRFQNISQSPNSSDTHPIWSPDGKSLVWVGEQDGIHSLFRQELSATGDESATQTVPVRQNLGSGNWPAWSADGETILTILQAPNHTYLTAYPAHYPGLVFPTIELPGNVNGLTWGKIALSSSFQTVYQQAAQLTPTPLYYPGLVAQPSDNGGRYLLIPLNGVTAPNPVLHDMVDESFQALRSRIAGEAGWDFLSSLENAYVPLTSPLDPGMGNDWLYTGRAFALDTIPMNAGWMIAMCEDYGAETYWRIYVKALPQDGSAGMPLHDLPWGFDARLNGDITDYENGGHTAPVIPSGYWIDFTERARAYGWERLPALQTWRDSTPAARFNEFVASGGKDWQTAMLELYPPEVMITPSPVIPPTRTPTATLRWYVSPTPTTTPTNRPTFTPIPTASSNPAG